MRIIRASRWPRSQFWGIAIAAVILGLMGLRAALSRQVHTDAVSCHVRALTGYPCPACGTTRMVMAAFRGDPGAAFLYNPLVAIAILAVVAHLVLRIGFKYRIVWFSRQKSVTRWTVILLVALLANWCYVLHYHGAY